jgi:hypothetical protein
MSNMDIEPGEIISVLNSQIANLNFELSVARIYISKLEKALSENGEDFVIPSTTSSTRNKTKN